MHTIYRGWWLSLVSVPVMLGLLVLDSRMTYTTSIHQIVQLGIAALAFGLVAIGMRGNPAVAEIQDARQLYREHHVATPKMLVAAPDSRRMISGEEPEPVYAMWLDQVSEGKGKYN